MIEPTTTKPIACSGCGTKSDQLYSGRCIFCCAKHGEAWAIARLNHREREA